jgi:O-antigen/teichoic acid export membrane protein
MLLRSADRTVILALISEEALGYFGIATIATSIIGTIPNAVHNVTIAPVMEKFGKTRNKDSVKNFFIEPMILIAYAIPVLIAGLYFFIHLPIDYFLTKFSQSIPVVKILIIGSFFQAAAQPALSISLAFNKQIKMIFLVVPLVALNFVLNIMLIRMGWGIEGVALGTGITFFASFCVLVYFALRQFEGDIKEYCNILMSVIAPFLYSILLILCIEVFIKHQIYGLWQDIFLTSLKASLFIGFYCIIFLRIRKHSAFIKLINNLPLAHLIPKKLKPRITH